jgi:hypothetical protein
LRRRMEWNLGLTRTVCITKLSSLGTNGYKVMRLLWKDSKINEVFVIFVCV